MQHEKTDIEKAKSLAKQGVTAAMFVSIVTTIVILINMVGVEVLNFDVWAFLDVALFLIIGFGIYKMSRIAAVLGLLLYIIEQIFMLLENGSKPTFMIVIMLTLFYNGIRGTFKYHKLKKINDTLNI